MPIVDVSLQNAKSVILIKNVLTVLGMNVVVGKLSANHNKKFFKLIILNVFYDQNQ